MYEVSLYQDNIAVGDNKKVEVKSNKEPKINEEGNLVFYDKSEIIFMFNEGSWQYWKKIEENKNV